MAMKRAIILAFASVTFIQAHEMVGDRECSSILTSTSPTSENSIMMAIANPTIGITKPPLMATHAPSHRPTISGARTKNSSSIPAQNFYSKIMSSTSDSLMTASWPIATHTPHIPSMAEKHSMTTMGIGSTGTGGMSMPNASVIASQPFLGNGVVSGVSVSVCPTHEPPYIMRLTG
ncbi:hypothetical protein O1611_g7038 [Lasiodiplodia mahajangana]|uniref:Uncharacterized protein n=1 Tax=Lasiodiplodia mahajangana TaxID=1108764 RepID=A0ACC2JGW0_9PEZI|nr:hypothetical protein O1611_g7038 [Lasiodiplodia mahajangana]